MPMWTRQEVEALRGQLQASCQRAKEAIALAQAVLEGAHETSSKSAVLRVRLRQLRAEWRKAP